ncbi:MAG: selenobiotic family radical SAM modification target peptide [Deltaproteobacteria bacterium]|nr:selenobiotic family radical SAM modification target peptide [Deltaproteobacteria bacterium]
MDKQKLKKILAGFSIAGLLAGAGCAGAPSGSSS